MSDRNGLEELIGEDAVLKRRVKMLEDRLGLVTDVLFGLVGPGPAMMEFRRLWKAVENRK